MGKNLVKCHESQSSFIFLMGGHQVSVTSKHANISLPEPRNIERQKCIKVKITSSTADLLGSAYPPS